MKHSETMSKMTFLVAVLITACTLQSCTDSPKEVKETAAEGEAPTYKEMVADNPTAEADLMVMAEFSNAIAAGDSVKMKSLLSDTAMMYGPSPADSSSGAQYVTSWVEGGFKTATNREIAFVQQTFKVLQGNLAGNWVSQWGDYSFTQAGKTVKFPYHSISRIVDGKIVSSRLYYDREYALTQLGFKLTQPEPVK